MQEKVKYNNCHECGGKCCLGFGLPLDYIKVMFNYGVPLDLFKSKLDENPRRYFELHKGITISDDGKRFIVDLKTDLKIIDGYIMVLSKCTQLSPDGKCLIYETRPDMCRNFNKENKEFYNVPAGCKYE